MFKDRPTPATDEVFHNQNILSRAELREFQELVSGSSCDMDDDFDDGDLPEFPGCSPIGMSIVDKSELARWSLGDIVETY